MKKTVTVVFTISSLEPYQLAIVAAEHNNPAVRPWAAEVIRLRAEIARRDDEIARLKRDHDSAFFGPLRNFWP